MRCRALLAATILALAAILTGPAHAAERLALVIGNAEYSGTTLPKLATPASDAALIASTLEGSGFEVTLVLDAELATMKRAIAEFAQRLAEAPDALAFFYFSGHGFRAKGLNYLAPLDAGLNGDPDAEREAMSVDWVLARLETAHHGANVIVLDACRATALAGGAGPGLASPSRAPAESFIAYAAGPGTTSAEEPGPNSPYTAAVAREIARPGLGIDEAFRNVRRAVVQKTGGAQIPWDSSSLTREIVLTPARAGRADVPQGALRPARFPRQDGIGYLEVSRAVTGPDI